MAIMYGKRVSPVDNESNDTLGIIQAYTSSTGSYEVDFHQVHEDGDTNHGKGSVRRVRNAAEGIVQYTLERG